MEIVGHDYNLPYNTRLGTLPGVLYDGALHWFLYDTKKKIVILSFDLSLEEFKEIPLPDDTKYVCDDYDILEMFEECLCIYGSYDYDIRVMRNYGRWQLLPHDDEGYKYVVAAITCTLHRFPDNTWRFCDYDHGKEDVFKQSWFNSSFPVLVKSLVSPYLHE
ncbi:F-box/kelch-repeat protein At3g06240-like [Rutidosis leptorrhynchoides]|uniref:F-box/kelch-repeat protein At3g06240-like n=1 Tax=Rutidosis leptorrhynchoides TaxID=125765 RepID=UPI003A996922